MAKKIYLDPGHGGSDAGAVKGARYEKTDALNLCLLIAKELEGQHVEVKLSRTDDSKVPNLDTRISAANTWKADYYLSVHRNAATASATGNEIWVISTATQNTVLKAKIILDAVCKVDGLSNRGVKKGAVGYTDYGVNSKTNMASALLELGFISNDKDNTVFDKCINDYAKVIAKALSEIVGVEFKEEQIIPAKPTAALARKLLRISTGLQSPDSLSPEEKALVGDAKITAALARKILKKSSGLE